MTTYEDYAVDIKRRLRKRKHECSDCHALLSEITRTEQTLAGAIAEKRNKPSNKRLIIAVEKLGSDLESTLRKAKDHVDRMEER